MESKEDAVLQESVITINETVASDQKIKIYRTSKLNQVALLNRVYLTSFEKDLEVLIEPTEYFDVEGENLQDQLNLNEPFCYRKLRLHRDGNRCECYPGEWYCGLFQNSSGHGILVSSLQEANELIDNATSFPVNMMLNWISNEDERIKLMKDYQKLTKAQKGRGRKLKLAYGCYIDNRNRFTFIHDGKWCNQVDENEITLFPAYTELQEVYVELKDAKLKYAFDRPLPIKGWAPHCIRLLCSASPGIFKDSYEREFWNCCVSIFHYLPVINDFDVALNLMKFLSTMENGNYSLVSVKDIVSVPILQSICQGIISIAQVMYDVDEVNHLLVVLNQINQVIDLKLASS